MNEGMNKVLKRWNGLGTEFAVAEILPCCGSKAWAEALTARRPIADEASLLRLSDQVWDGLPAPDWLEAFATHPRIGERKAPVRASAQSAAWSAQEQQASAADETVQSALAEGNREYERKFGRVFLVCATGKSAAEILAILKRRLQNGEATELREAAEEQRKITNLRLTKWLSA
jgi:2-oxo-4-hydroxy-4-carboxy-5-ureidoimidazoline decarboxylase